ncbi:hypothetical protein EV193_103570 [Herbihabitans rhizosphaerae]|uniref:Uncharacterized protein n=1 Tax=Herbihabitans rhizosphaerae TaxID=1872711 RepID=A0A4Q7KW27_9PSEU|nr:hypothetical protein EV193_103570 [Herbihabitans rhizosphaerae]
MSFYAAEANRPGLDDLAGLLCGQGQMAGFAGMSARLSVVVEERWRARAIAAGCAERGVDVQLGATDEGFTLVRTAFRSDLASLAARWTRGAVKAVPPGVSLDGATLRLWALAAGRWLDTGYLLGLDARAPDTHEPLAKALTRAGITVRMVGSAAGGPGLRITGRRRIARLAELIGPMPDDSPEEAWPALRTA